MKPTRVIIQLAGGNFVTAHYASADDASELIRRWADGCLKRINNGDLDSLETSLYTGTDSAGRLGMAVLARYIIAMYIPRDEKTAADRMADVMEKCHNEGDEWRGD